MNGALRTVAARGVDGLCSLAGRRQVVRAARFVLHRSRLDLPNNPHLNGEFALQRWLVAAAPPTEPLVAFDVGANLGIWSRRLLRLTAATGHRVSLHAFEPASYTYRRLVSNLPSTVRVNRLALSDQCSEQTLYVIRPGAGRNSLHQPPDVVSLPEPVITATVDDYLAATGVDHIDLLKVDTEGHDFPVLRGAERALHGGLISAVQFEYGHRWVYARHYLKDVFDLVGPLGYRVGKVTPAGVELYPGWDPDLETFVEGNYVVLNPTTAARLPQVRWWKTSTGGARCTSV